MSWPRSSLSDHLEIVYCVCETGAGMNQDIVHCLRDIVLWERESTGWLTVKFERQVRGGYGVVLWRNEDIVNVDCSSGEGEGDIPLCSGGVHT